MTSPSSKDDSDVEEGVGNASVLTRIAPVLTVAVKK